MKVVLIRKLADKMDGVDVASCEVGDVLDLSPHDARALMAERWAIADRRHHDGPPPENERRRTESHDSNVERAS